MYSSGTKKVKAPILSNIVKLLMNSSYGKMLQRLLVDELQVFSADSSEDIARLRKLRSEKRAN